MALGASAVLTTLNDDMMGDEAAKERRRSEVDGASCFVRGSEVSVRRARLASMQLTA